MLLKSWADMSLGQARESSVNTVTSVSEKQRPLRQEVSAWLGSGRGQAAARETVEQSQREIKTLADARQVKPEHLHVPITL